MSVNSIPAAYEADHAGTTAIPAHRNVARAIAEAIVSGQGGATIDHTGRPLESTTGYVVALGAPATAVVHTSASVEVLAETVARFAADYWHIISTGYYVGAWESNGLVYLDVSEVETDRQRAIRKGTDRNQQAIWDLATETEIETGGTGDIERLLDRDPWNTYTA